jgi:glycosyltransferase involved in cell wall biosynthesis
LHQFPNVFFLGSKKESQLPNYLKGFDVAINPQLENHLTIGNYPRKIDEYLAMGKPVVATKTKAMEMFQNYVYQCSSYEEYSNLIETALSENSSQLEQERIAFANSHTWENNVNKIYNAILKATKNNVKWD